MIFQETILGLQLARHSPFSVYMHSDVSTSHYKAISHWTRVPAWWRHFNVITCLMNFAQNAIACVKYVSRYQGSDRLSDYSLTRADSCTPGFLQTLGSLWFWKPQILAISETSEVCSHSHRLAVTLIPRLLLHPPCPVPFDISRSLPGRQLCMGAFHWGIIANSV